MTNGCHKHELLFYSQSFISFKVPIEYCWIISPCTKVRHRAHHVFWPYSLSCNIKIAYMYLVKQFAANAETVPWNFVGFVLLKIHGELYQGKEYNNLREPVYTKNLLLSRIDFFITVFASLKVGFVIAPMKWNTMSSHQYNSTRWRSRLDPEDWTYVLWTSI